MTCDVFEVGQHQVLKGLHGNCLLSVVIQSSDRGFLGQWDDSGTSHRSSDLLNICVKIDASWTAQMCAEM